jgi:NDP-sugar pyrophosphorylase family protein
MRMVSLTEAGREGRLGGFRIEGYWRGVDTVKDIMEASAEFAASD